MSEKHFEFSLAIFGLDGAGKTSIFQILKGNYNGQLIGPTVGFRMDVLDADKTILPIVVYDFSGEGRHRPMWQSFYNQIDAIMFVIDSKDVARLRIAKDYLEKMFENELIRKRNIPIAIICNKEDLLTKTGERFDIDEIKREVGYAHFKGVKTGEVKSKFFSFSAYAPDKKAIPEFFTWIRENVKSVNEKDPDNNQLF